MSEKKIKLKQKKAITIKTKLISGFLLISILLGIIGGLGILYINRIATSGEKMYSYNFKSINGLHIVKEKYLEMKGYIDVAVVCKDNERTNEEVKRISNLNKQMAGYLYDYGQLPLSEKEKETWNNFLAHDATYIKIRQEVLDLAWAGEYEKAMEKMSKLDSISNTIISKINDLVNNNDQMASFQNNENMTNAKTLTIGMTIAIGISFLIAIIIGIWIAINISKSVKKGLSFAMALGQGDLTMKIVTKKEDELGKLISSLGTAQENIRKMIINITQQIKKVSSSSEDVSATLEEIHASFEIINHNAETINKELTTIRDSINSLTITIEQMNSGISSLAESATEGNLQAIEISSHAKEIKEQGEISKKLADQLYIEKQKNIIEAIEQGKVVNEIIKIAHLIEEITRQTNLLSLNASIEAARAGEHGRGFAVVANSIGELASQSASYVKEITTVVQNVEEAFNNLAKNSEEVLKFIDEQVRPDYDLLVQTGTNYEKDAVYLSEFSEVTASMTQEINASTEEISNVIRVISGNVAETSNGFAQIKEKINQTSEGLEQIAQMAQEQTFVAETLNTSIESFKIE